MRLLNFLFRAAFSVLKFCLRSLFNLVKAFIYTIAGITMIAAVVLLIRGVNEFADVLESVTAEQVQTLENLPPFESRDILTNDLTHQYNSLIGIYRKDEKGKLQFHCSAFVVSNKYAITASHCLVEADGQMTKGEIYVYNSDLRDTKVIAKAASINTRSDQGAMIGDFRNFFKIRMNTDKGFMNLTGPYLACGFPWGATPPSCLPFKPQSGYYAETRGEGYLYPGMSGGPVIDTITNLVAGINTEVHDGFVVVSPVIGLWGALEIGVRQ